MERIEYKQERTTYAQRSRRIAGWGKLFFSLMIAVISSTTLAKASDMKVVNENKKQLTIKIQAEGSKINEKLKSYKVMIPAEHEYRFVVTREDLNGKNLFSIEGDTSAFSPGGTCKNLDTDRDYKLVFKNDTYGTSCVATPFTR